MSMIPKPQEIYRHFKGNLYQIVTVAEHSETGEKLVIYQALYGDFKIYARELSMFMSKVDRVKYPNAPQENRFELVSLGVMADVTENEAAAQDAGAEQTATTDRADVTVQTAETQETSNNEETAELDPLLIEYLDADSYEGKLNVLAALHHRITQDMITIMAVSSDIEVSEGDLEERYSQLKNCLLTMEKYECSRVR